MTSRWKAFLGVGASVIAAIAGATFALRAVTTPDEAEPILGAAPYGYTISLLLFLIPVVIFGSWFALHRRRDLVWKAFWHTVLPWTGIGFLLDFALASRLFVFPDPSATLRINVPVLAAEGLGFHCVPIEEFIFYFAGFLSVLLLYIWLVESWLPEPAKPQAAPLPRRILQLDQRAIWLGLLVLGAGWTTKLFLNPGGLPLYLIFLVIFAVVPPAALFKATVERVNWQAFGITLFWILLISLIWEVTLALPYGYWGYRPEAMIGLKIQVWSNLPIEAVLVWFSVAFSTILTFEAAKIRLQRAD